jgi:glycosyltransferase involved in cell wall biosynthesis
MPEVSVIVPTHNRRAWLLLTLESVLSQQDVDVETIVVDDGSTDDTVETIHALDDRRIRLLSHESPRGVAATRNHGAAEASAPWLGFIDDDDVWAPEKLAHQLDAARVDRRAWVYTGSVNIDDGLRVLAAVRPPPPAEVVRLVPRRNVIPGGGSNVIVRRESFEQVGPFETRLKNTEDWEMWIRLAKEGPPAWVPEPLLAYRVHSANASLDIDAIFAGVSLIERRHGTQTDRGVLHRWISESCLRTGQRQQALKHLALAAIHGQSRSAAVDLVKVLRRRVERHLPFPATRKERTADDWIARAQTWVDELSARTQAMM